MAQSVATVDLGKVYQGTAASGGGTFTADYAIPTNQVGVLHACAIGTAASAGALTGALVLYAEYVVENRGGTLTAGTALSSSNNPANSSTTTFIASHAQVQDYITSSPTLVWSISGTNGRCTFTNNTTTSTNVTIVVEAVLVGST